MLYFGGACDKFTRRKMANSPKLTPSCASPPSRLIRAWLNHKLANNHTSTPPQALLGYPTTSDL